EKMSDKTAVRGGSAAYRWCDADGINGLSGRADFFCRYSSSGAPPATGSGPDLAARPDLGTNPCAGACAAVPGDKALGAPMCSPGEYTIRATPIVRIGMNESRGEECTRIVTAVACPGTAYALRCIEDSDCPEGQVCPEGSYTCTAK